MTSHRSIRSTGLALRDLAPFFDGCLLRNYEFRNKTRGNNLSKPISTQAATTHARPTPDSGHINVWNEELRTAREAMRELNRMVDRLERGEIDKFVLTRKTKMRVVLLSLEQYRELLRA